MKTVRNQIAFDHALKEELEICPFESTAKDELRQRLVSIWEKYQFEYAMQFSFELPSSISQTGLDNINSSLTKTIKEFENTFQSFLHSILIERCHLEIKLFLDEHRF